VEFERAVKFGTCNQKTKFSDPIYIVGLPDTQFAQVHLIEHQTGTQKFVYGVPGSSPAAHGTHKGNVVDCDAHFEGPSEAFLCDNVVSLRAVVQNPDFSMWLSFQKTLWWNRLIVFHIDDCVSIHKFLPSVVSDFW
jgi:hypothetical protein